MKVLKPFSKRDKTQENKKKTDTALDTPFIVKALTHFPPNFILLIQAMFRSTYNIFIFKTLKFLYKHSIQSIRQKGVTDTCQNITKQPTKQATTSNRKGK